MSIETMVAICVPVIALIFTVMSFKRNVTKDTEENATERATMSADIKYIRTSIDDIKVDNRVIKSDISNLQAKVARVEQSVDSAHKRLDDFMNVTKG